MNTDCIRWSHPVVAYLTVLDLGFGNAIVRYTAKFRAEAKTKEQYEMFGMFLVLYCAIGLVALGAGFGLYLHIDTLFGDTMSPEELGKVRVMMLLMVFNIAFTFPMSIWGAVINAYEKFVFPKAINITRIVLNTVIMVVLLEFRLQSSSNGSADYPVQIWLLSSSMHGIANIDFAYM